MIFKKTEKLTVLSDENLENVSGGLNVTIYDEKASKPACILTAGVLAVSLIGFGICVISRIKKFFK